MKQFIRITPDRDKMYINRKGIWSTEVIGGLRVYKHDRKYNTVYVCDKEDLNYYKGK